MPMTPLKKQGEILVNATTFRFDGSDLMPGKIGAGAFWTGMVDLSAASPPPMSPPASRRAWDAIK
jgi:alpha-glucoside transport system substrate-binding protein